MKAAVCTLFEGNYHYGLASWVNSLYHAGFRGEVYAGFRGALPPWAGAAKSRAVGPWANATCLEVGTGLELIFLPLETKNHLANYKPDLMLALLDGPCADQDALFYFDPDIAVAKPWSFFEIWATCGIAACEDILSPAGEHHPRRVGWRRHFARHGITLTFKDPTYVNSGFLGISRGDKELLNVWKRLQELLASEIGGLDRSPVSANAQLAPVDANAFCFDKPDQDALNAAIEAYPGKPSFANQQAMGFAVGDVLLPHALGAWKPWKRSYVRDALNGRRPGVADKAYWQHAGGPLRAYSESALKWHRLRLKIGTAIGRFIAR